MHYGEFRGELLEGTVIHYYMIKGDGRGKLTKDGNSDEYTEEIISIAH